MAFMRAEQDTRCALPGVRLVNKTKCSTLSRRTFDGDAVWQGKKTFKQRNCTFYALRIEVKI